MNDAGGRGEMDQAATNEVQKAKQALRREMRLSRRALSSEGLDLAGRSVALLVEQRRADLFPWGVDAGAPAPTVLLYAALPDELPLLPLDRLLRQLGARVAYPRVEGDRLVLAEATPALMWPGTMGIAEPPSSSVAVDPSEVDVAFVPGLGFDRAGRRIGYGRGYFDRLLASTTRTLRVGVCLAGQVVDRVPAEPHDLSMDYLLVAVPGTGGSTLDQTHARDLGARRSPSSESTPHANSKEHH